jgi:hypothetical protein
MAYEIRDRIWIFLSPMLRKYQSGNAFHMLYAIVKDPLYVRNLSSLCIQFRNVTYTENVIHSYL